MSENLALLKDNKSLYFHLKLLFIISLNKIESVDTNNSIKGLPFEYEDIKSIQELNNPYFLIFLYINKDIIHDKLYDKEEMLSIDFEIINEKISQYIYLCFLIEYCNGTEMCDYQYSFELINKLNKIQICEKEKIFKKIIMAKMILSLVDNYNQIVDNKDNENNKHGNELKAISEFNSKLFDDKDYITKLNQYELKLEDFKSKKIEEIYSIIINYLIENSKLEDSAFIENIINQIELESIFLTKLMFDELIKILTIEKEYIKKYEINNVNDIFDKKKIYFYYNLIRYILKQSLYIYQIPFLLETRKKILNLIRNNLGIISTSIKNSEYNYQIEYILKNFISESSYKYYYEVSESIIRQSHNESSSLNPFSHSSYKLENLESKRNISDEFEFGGHRNVEYILDESKFILHTNKKGEIPFVKYDEIKIIKNGKEIENKTIEEIRNITTDNENLKKNYQKFISFLNKFESILSKDYINKYKLKITLNFKTKSIDYNNNFIITCLYDVEIPGENPQQFRDENILFNELGEGFNYMISEINSTNYSNIEYF